MSFSIFETNDLSVAQREERAAVAETRRESVRPLTRRRATSTRPSGRGASGEAARRVGRWRGRSAVGGRPVQLRLAARSQRGRWTTGAVAACGAVAVRSVDDQFSRGLCAVAARSVDDRCSRDLWRGRSAVGERPLQLRFVARAAASTSREVSR